MIKQLISLAEKRFLPDFIVRTGIKYFLNQKLNIEKKKFSNNPKSKKDKWVEEMKNSPIALFTNKANEQHYEVPPEFFRISLGPNLKYSCAYWDTEINNLADAEEKMFKIYIERSGIKNGMSILDLGCGWGSFSLYLAKKFPNSKILAVSNSNDHTTLKIAIRTIVNKLLSSEKFINSTKNINATELKMIEKKYLASILCK